jgi:Ser-tRNA(Ala) deacylase AlaX
MATLTPEMINLDWLKSATLKDLKSAMYIGGDVLKKVNELLVTPEGKKIGHEMLNDPDYVPMSKRQPDPEELEQINSDTQLADQQAAEAEATRAAQAEAADALVEPVTSVEADASAKLSEVLKNLEVARAIEDEAARKLGLTIVRSASGAVEKVVHDYQVTDEDGKAIGRSTHFESVSLIEAIGKIMAAHINAVRYAERSRSQRFKQAADSMRVAEKSAQAKALEEEANKLAEEAVNSKDPAKYREAAQKSLEAERKAKELAKDEAERGRLIAQAWMDEHVDDFLPCGASSQIMREYMAANGLSMGYDNLEKAFQAVKHQLPKPVRQAVSDPVSAAPVNNPPAAAPVTDPLAPANNNSPAAASASAQPPTAQPPAVPTPAATAPTATPAATANPSPAARRPGVNGGLQPGSLSAQRPSAAQATETPQATRSKLLREIAKMGPDQLRKKLKDTNYRSQLEAAGIKYQ